MIQPKQVAIGGKVRSLAEDCTVDAFIEGKYTRIHAFVIDDLGRDERGRSIDMLFGALAMQQWGVYPVPHEERLDLSHYSDEFVEY